MHPSASLLGNGRYATLVRPSGTGFSAWDGLALTHFSADPTLDGGGLVVYLREPDGGRLWSVGRLPAGRADHYTARAEDGTVTLAREDGELATTLTTWVAAEADVELRRLTIENRGTAQRSLEVATYAEVVLHDPALHLGHPAFAKLFVETESIDGMLIARRRPRSHGDRTPCLVHALLGPGPVEWDTDRARVLGRGHDLERPRALATSAPFGATVGSVLDPVLCLRRRVDVEPGARVTLFVVLGAGASRDEVLALGRRFADPATCERAPPRRRRRDDRAAGRAPCGGGRRLRAPPRRHRGAALAGASPGAKAPLPRTAMAGSWPEAPNTRSTSIRAIPTDLACRPCHGSTSSRIRTSAFSQARPAPGTPGAATAANIG